MKKRMIVLLLLLLAALMAVSCTKDHQEIELDSVPAKTETETPEATKETGTGKSVIENAGADTTPSFGTLTPPKR